jgi:outer membrane protein assembly factor BamB
VKSAWLLIILAGIFIFNSCKDVIFNNPLDPDASKEDLRIIKTISTKLIGAGDISYDGEKIWKADISGIISSFETISGSILKTLYASSSTGIAFHNDTLYIVNRNTNTIKCFDPLSGQLNQSIITGNFYFQFLASYQDELIAFDSRSSNIVRFNPKTGKSLNLFQLSGMSLGGLAIYQNKIIFSEQNSNSVYFLSLSGEVLNVYNSPVQGMSGITADSQNAFIYIFTIDGKLHKVTVP